MSIPALRLVDVAGRFVCFGQVKGPRIPEQIVDVLRRLVLLDRRLQDIAHPGPVHVARRILDLGEDGLKRHIKTIGLFNSKAKNIIAASRMLVEQHQGAVPQQREALEALPGVGRKTANVVLNTAFGQPTIAVDTHIFRVCNRTGIAAGRNVAEVERKLVKLVPEEFTKDAHHWLILHGRYTCIARKPRCGSCIIEDLCEYRHKTEI